MFDKVLQAVLTEARKYTTLGIDIGSMPATNKLAMYLGAGGMTTQYLSGAEYQVSLALNGKHENQQTLLQNLSEVLGRLSVRNHINTPSFRGDGWQIINIQPTTTPNYIDYESAKKQWVYASVVRVTFIIKGGTYGHCFELG